MRFTFGIVSTGGSDERVEEAIDSIEAENIPSYEILISGASDVERQKTRVLECYEDGKKGMLSIQKNLITKEAKYSKIVYMHDFVSLCPGWYQGMVDFGGQWDLCMTKVRNVTGERFRDWCLSPLEELPPHISRCRMLPYSACGRHMYISGTYWIAKKKIMEEFPLNEDLGWGEGEDVEWSERVLQNARYVMNEGSAVQFQKWKIVSFVLNEGVA